MPSSHDYDQMSSGDRASALSKLKSKAESSSNSNVSDALQKLKDVEAAPARHAISLSVKMSALHSALVADGVDEGDLKP